MIRTLLSAQPRKPLQPHFSEWLIAGTLLVHEIGLNFRKISGFCKDIRSPSDRNLPHRFETSRLWAFCLAIPLLLSTGCSRSYLVHAPAPPNQLRISSIAVVPIQLEWQQRGLGSITGSSSSTLENFRDTLTQSALLVLSEMGTQGVAGIGSMSALSKTEQRDLAFESELDRRKVLADLELQDSFSTYARYIGRPPLDSLASARVEKHAKRLNVSAFLIMRFQAVELSDTEYLREWIRALLVTIGSIFLDTTLPHRSYITGDVLLLDGTTGRALFYNRVENFAGAPDSQDDTQELLSDLLTPLRGRLI